MHWKNVPPTPIPRVISVYKVGYHSLRERWVFAICPPKTPPPPMQKTKNLANNVQICDHLPIRGERVGGHQRHFQTLHNLCIYICKGDISITKLVALAYMFTVCKEISSFPKHIFLFRKCSTNNVVKESIYVIQVLSEQRIYICYSSYSYTN